MITKDTLKKQLNTLHTEGVSLSQVLGEMNPDTEAFEVAYQSWYTRALPLMKQLAADRYAEFRTYYQADPRRNLVLPFNYAIQDYFLGEKPNHDDFDLVGSSAVLCRDPEDRSHPYEMTPLLA